MFEDSIKDEIDYYKSKEKELIPLIGDLNLYEDFK